MHYYRHYIDIKTYATSTEDLTQSLFLKKYERQTANRGAQSTNVCTFWQNPNSKSKRNKQILLQIVYRSA